jgi:mannose-1-phosphate guanylyltransferase
MKLVNVILSGGVGSRLWPLSRKSKPKQYLPLIEGESLFEHTIKRNRRISESIIVVGGIENFKHSREAFAATSVSKYCEIVEACPKNTAAAIAFAAFEADPDDILLVTPSDHLIQSSKSYYSSINKAVELAKQGYLVTFGLKPNRPETGFGYIEFEGNDVISFHEKPDKKKAENFLTKNNFLWNSGMFCFTANTFLGELEKYSPEIYRTAKRAHFKKSGIFINRLLNDLIPSISVDYAVMEKSDKIKVVPSSFKWSDMGSFEAIYDLIPENDKRKILSNLYLGGNKKVEFLGVENIILVETDDVIMVLNKESAQDVKGIYDRLENENPSYLM